MFLRTLQLFSILKSNEVASIMSHKKKNLLNWASNVKNQCACISCTECPLASIRARGPSPNTKGMVFQRPIS